MTLDNNTEGADAQDGSMEDSPVIKALRKQIRDLENANKSAPTRESIEAEIRTELERESAISSQLIELGHPAGMSAFLKGKLEGDVTRESVVAALEGIGYKVEVPDAAEGSDGAAAAGQSDLARVASLSAQVASAASGASSDDIMQRINQAQTPAELQAIMAEAGALRSAL